MTRTLAREPESTMFDDARRAGREALQRGPLAVAVRVEASSRGIDVELSSGVRFIVPARLIQGLGNASIDELSDVEVWADGLVIHWRRLDVQMHVPSMVAGVFGNETWMSELGRAGGRVKSAAKAQAARLNGKKGGRPKRTSG